MLQTHGKMCRESSLLSLPNKISKGVRTLVSGDRLWWRALRQGVAPSLEHVQVLPLMQSETVVDIGANRGQFALAIRHVFPDARILSFEPLADPAAKFIRVFHGDARVRLHEIAIGPEAGETTIHVSEHNDSSSVFPIGTEQNRSAALSVTSDRQGIHPPALLRQPPDGDVLEGGRFLLPAKLYPTLTVVGHIRAPSASGWSVDQGVSEQHRGSAAQTHRYMDWCNCLD